MSNTNGNSTPATPEDALYAMLQVASTALRQIATIAQTLIDSHETDQAAKRRARDGATEIMAAALEDMTGPLCAYREGGDVVSLPSGVWVSDGDCAGNAVWRVMYWTDGQLVQTIEPACFYHAAGEERTTRQLDLRVKATYARIPVEVDKLIHQAAGYEDCTHGADCLRHPDVRALHNFDGYTAPCGYAFSHPAHMWKDGDGVRDHRCDGVPQPEQAAV